MELHDGSKVILKKLAPDQHDPTDKLAAIRLLEEARAKQQFITGLIYLDNSRESLAEAADLPETPLSALGPDLTRPSRASLEKIMAGMA